MRPLAPSPSSSAEAAHAHAHATGAARTALRAPDVGTPAPRRPAATAIGTASRAAVLTDALQRRASRARATAELPVSLADFAAAQATGDADRAARSLQRRIRAHLDGGTVEVRLTDNRYSMISVRRDAGPRYQVRLHHMFAGADPAVTRALARYIGSNDGDASRLLGDFIDGHQHRVRPVRRPAAQTLDTRGRFHDLQAIFDGLNRRYFAGRIDARITWGLRLGRPRRRNSIKMGSYSVEDRLIRMHRALDRAFVPPFFVEWIVFHEMLHQVHDADVVNGRRHFHTRAFVEDEARFEHYAAARAWERANLDALLTY